MGTLVAANLTAAAGERKCHSNLEREWGERGSPSVIVVVGAPSPMALNATTVRYGCRVIPR